MGSAGFWSGITCGSGYDCPAADLGVFATSQVMGIGFSNGGGFAMYLNWVHGSKVTQAVAIDYWGYANYTNWMWTLLSTIQLARLCSMPTSTPTVRADTTTRLAAPIPPTPTRHRKTSVWTTPSLFLLL